MARKPTADDLARIMAEVERMKSIADQPIHFAQIISPSIGPGSILTPPRAKSRATLDSYTSHTWVHAIVSKIAGSVAGAKWFLNNPEGERVDAHPILDFLREGSEYMTGRESVNLLAMLMELTGEGPILIARGKGKMPVAWLPIPGTWVASIAYKPGDTWQINPENSRSVTVPFENLIFLKRPSPVNPFHRGASLVQALNAELNFDRALSDTLYAFLKNHARPDVIISGEENSPLGEEDMARLEALIPTKYAGASNAGKPLLSRSPIKVTVVPKSLRDMQAHEIRASSIENIMSAWGIPPEIMGRLENSNRATIDGADYHYNKHVILPRLEAMRDVMQIKLSFEFPELANGWTLQIESPVSEDKPFKLQAMTAFPHAYHINEARALTGDKPIDGGDTEPLGMSAADMQAAADLATNGEEEPKTPAGKFMKAFAERKVRKAKSLTAEGVVEVSEAHEQPQVRSDVTRMLRGVWEALIAEYGAEAIKDVSAGLRFALTERINDWAKDAVLQSVRYIDETTRGQLRDAVLDVLRNEGSTAAEIKAAVQGVFTDANLQRSRIIAQTEATKIVGQTTLEALKQGNVDRKMFLTTGDDLVRHNHSEMDGQIRKSVEPFDSPDGDKGMGPGQFSKASNNINCILEGQRVLGSVQAVTRMRYSGPAISLGSASGAVVRVTPNHPLLTGDGWVAAKDIKRGTKLVRCVGNIQAADVLLAGRPTSGGVKAQDVEDVPATVDEVFGALAQFGGAVVSRGSKDFHGDAQFGNGDIEIVAVNRELLLNAAAKFSEDGRNVVLKLADAAGSAFANSNARFVLGLSAHHGQPINGALGASTKAIGVGPVLLPRHGGLRDLVANFDAIAAQTALEGAGADAKVVRDFCNASAGQVQFDEVVEIVNVDWFSGHVYDLQCVAGIMTCNGLIVHNCRCATRGVYEGEGEAKAAQLIDIGSLIPKDRPDRAEYLKAAQAAMDRMAERIATAADQMFDVQRKAALAAVDRAFGADLRRKR